MTLRIRDDKRADPQWKLRTSSAPELRFFEPIPKLARRVFSDASQSKETLVEVEAIGMRSSRVELLGVSRLMEQCGPPEYWCVSWLYSTDFD